MLLFLNSTGVEKKNDDFRRFFIHKINKWDTCRDLVVVEKRLESLQDERRVPRHYRKANEAYWCNGGKQAAAANLKRKAHEQGPPPPPPPSPAVNGLTETALSRMTVTALSKLVAELQGRKIGKYTKRVLINQILQEQEKRGQ